MINIKYSDEEVKKKRKTVTEGLFKESVCIDTEKIIRISVSDLQILYKYYDAVFFNDWFKNNFKGRMLFELSRRMTRSAGITKCPKNISRINPVEVKITICIGVDFFLRFDQLEGSKMVCGIETNSSLEALQIVFEHELLHALELILFHKSSCKGKRFIGTAKNMFGHTKSHHQMPTNRCIAGEKLGINIGDRVQFVYEEKKLLGVVTNINKRATVMVKSRNGSFFDQYGNRYMKYYVPLGSLGKV